MKTIGLIGGMSWESTVTYYQIMNRRIAEKLGSLHSAKILMYSIDFDELAELQEKGMWDQSYQMMSEAASRLEKAGADFIVIGANTMHKAVPEMEKHLTVPIVHIAKATADVLKENGMKKAGLLGTKYTVTEDFYKKVLIEEGLDVLISDEQTIEEVNRIIYEELCTGKLYDTSRETLIKAVNDLYERGAECVILGCTELGLLINETDTDVPLFDTTVIHAQRAADLSLE